MQKTSLAPVPSGEWFVSLSQTCPEGSLGQYQTLPKALFPLTLLPRCRRGTVMLRGCCESGRSLGKVYVGWCVCEPDSSEVGLATSPSVEPRSSRAAHSAAEPVPESSALYWGGGGESILSLWFQRVPRLQRSRCLGAGGGQPAPGARSRAAGGAAPAGTFRLLLLF